MTSFIVWLSFNFELNKRQCDIGPSGQSIPAQVSQTADSVFKADFVPRSVGEHKISVTINGRSTTGSPYSAKVNKLKKR